MRAQSKVRHRILSHAANTLHKHTRGAMLYKNGGKLKYCTERKAPFLVTVGLRQGKEQHTGNIPVITKLHQSTFKAAPHFGC